MWYRARIATFSIFNSPFSIDAEVNIMRQLFEIAEDARRSKYAVAKLGTNDKNRGILAIADTL
mgnify:FL=1